MVGWNQVQLPVPVPRQELGESLESLSALLLEFASADQQLSWRVSFEEGVGISHVSGGNLILGTAHP